MAKKVVKKETVILVSSPNVKILTVSVSDGGGIYCNNRYSTPSMQTYKSGYNAKTKPKRSTHVRDTLT